MQTLRTCARFSALLVLTAALGGVSSSALAQAKGAPTTKPGASTSPGAGAKSSAAATSAKPAAAPEHDAIQAAATELYDRGIKAMNEQRWDDCRASFLAAFNIDRYYQIAGNLGSCELKLGRYVDAAEHLSFSLHAMPATAPPERRALAEKLLAEVRPKVSELTIQSNKTGAEIFLDGRSLGRAPLASAVFVEPGAHKIEAKLDAATAHADVTATGGGTQSVTVSFEEPKKVEPPQRSLAPAYAMGGLGAASLIAGGVLLGLGEATRADLVSSTPKNADGTLVCAKAPAPGTADPECNDLRSRIQLGTTMGQAGIGLLIAGGVLGLGAAGYFVFAPRRSPTTAIHLVPVASATSAGVQILGAF